MTERQKDTPLMSDESVKLWLKFLRDGDSQVDMQIGKALEVKDPVALFFVERALEIDPAIIEHSSFGLMVDIMVDIKDRKRDQSSL